MRTLLQIGEIAQLLGVTPKTIRHYQKIGLLEEPARTEAGYRLYNAYDLLRLRRIRRLQTLGLSLKQIKAVLGEPSHEHTLREVLQSLDQELALQIRELEVRRERIGALLNEQSLDMIDQPTMPFGLERAKELLGERFSSISPAVLEMEAKLWAPIENFNWPGEYQEGMMKMAQYFAEHPEIYEQLIAFGEQFASLASLPQDAPEVDQMIERCMENSALLLFLQNGQVLATQIPHMENPFGEILGDLMVTALSPAQRHFFEKLSHRLPASRKEV